MKTESSIDQAVREALETVVDPEIPVCRIVDLGLVEDVRISEAAIEIDLLPTFVGCPALEIIRRDVEAAVKGVAGDRTVNVQFLLDRPWTTDRVNARAAEAMKELGIAPPGERRSLTLVQISVRCPYCGASDTAHEATFGPTPCRSVRYCPSCRNPFEAFKPK